jgi:hypothetical protein
MTPIILDTRALLQEYADFAPFFQFYEMGLRDLIREAVITRSFNSPYTTQYHPGHRYSQGLAAKVKMDFEFALDHHHDSFGADTPVALYNLKSALNNIEVIGQIAEAMERSVDDLLFMHLRTKLFEIAQEGSGEAVRPRWIGPDLAVFIRMLSHKELRIWVPPHHLS